MKNMRIMDASAWSIDSRRAGQYDGVADSEYSHCYGKIVTIVGDGVDFSTVIEKNNGPPV